MSCRVLEKIFFRLFLYSNGGFGVFPRNLLFFSILFSHFVLFFAIGNDFEPMAFSLTQIYRLFI